MALQSITNINIDFYDKRHIIINAKQLDRNSRLLSVTCYNHGEPFSLNNGEHAAYVRYRKADNYGVFNNCDINNKGKIIVNLTEQMLAADGICYADLVIVNKGKAEVNPNTGEINELIENASVLSTMTFCIDVSEVPVSNSDIESAHEFILLNENLERYWADFEDVMKTSKSWAVGDTGIRDGENTNNSKYWSIQSKNSASAASKSSANAAESEKLAGEHEAKSLECSENAYSYMEDAKKHMERANNSETNASNSASAALTSEVNAKDSETKSKTSETNALTSEQNAKASETNAMQYMNNAKTSETNALISEQNAKSSETNAANSEENAKQSQIAAEASENNAKQAASQAAELAAQNAVDDVIELVSGYTTSSQEASVIAESSKQSALISEQNAKTSEINANNSQMSALASEQNAKESETNAANSKIMAQSYAIGGTGTRDEENIDNAKFYYESAQSLLSRYYIANVDEVKDYLGI
jgi:hypothetical protein